MSFPSSGLIKALQYISGGGGEKGGGRLTTPWKINMEPTNHPFRKENDLRKTSRIMCKMLIFRCVGWLPPTKLRNQHLFHADKSSSFSPQLVSAPGAAASKRPVAVHVSYGTGDLGD